MASDDAAAIEDGYVAPKDIPTPPSPGPVPATLFPELAPPPPDDLFGEDDDANAEFDLGPPVPDAAPAPPPPALALPAPARPASADLFKDEVEDDELELGPDASEGEPASPPPMDDAPAATIDDLFGEDDGHELDVSSPAAAPPLLQLPSPPALLSPPTDLFGELDDGGELDFDITGPSAASPPPSRPSLAPSPPPSPPLPPPTDLFGVEEDGGELDFGITGPSAAPPPPSPPSATPSITPPAPPPIGRTMTTNPYKTANPWATTPAMSAPVRPVVSRNPYTVAPLAPASPSPLPPLPRAATANPWGAAPLPLSTTAVAPTPAPPPPPAVARPPPPGPPRAPPRSTHKAPPAVLAPPPSAPTPPPRAPSVPLPPPHSPPPRAPSMPPPGSSLLHLPPQAFAPVRAPQAGFSPSSVSPRAPVISFGFGGKLLIVYPGLGMPIGGLARGDEGDASTVRILDVAEIVSPASSSTSAETFPGPLFLDPSSAKGAAGAKAKKGVVLGYIQARAAETEHALGWLKTQIGSDETRYREEEGKAVLLRLIGVMVENEGRLSGSAKVEDEVRLVLHPDLAAAPSRSLAVHSAPLGMTSASTAPSSLYSTSPPAQTTGFHSSRPSLDGAAAPTHSANAGLDHLSYLLLRGEKKEAVRFATEEKLWSHALVISSCLDKQTWADVVKAFAAAELGVNSALPPSGKGRQALRLTYEMLSGAPGPGAGSLSDQLTGQVRRPPADRLDEWREAAAMLSANRGVGDKEALLALGDSLVSAGWLHAGHACFLLSSHPPPLDPLGGLTPPRIHLYGASSSARSSQLLDAIIMTELIEFALSLVPLVKGQEPFSGLPTLQAYRLVHATFLAERGETGLAQRYCEAIVASLKATKIPSPSHTLTFVNHLRELSERISGTGAVDKSGSWISRTVAKPTLDGLGSWFEGRITKFVAGEGEESASAPPVAAPDPSQQVGPFSHYAPVSAWSSDAGTNDYSTNDYTPYTPAATAATATPTGGDYPGYAAPAPAWSDDAGAGSFAGYRPSGGYTPHEFVPEPEAPEPETDAAEPEPAVDDTPKAEPKEEKKKPAPAAKEEAKPTSSWLGKLWGGKKEATPPTTPGTPGAPIKAKLGEESAFYFDKDLKRWVNKKAGADASAPAAPPPPPPRAQTSSPSRSMRPPPAGGPGAPPLPRGPPSASSGLSSPSMLGAGGPPAPPHSRVASAPGPPRLAGGPPPAPSSGLASQSHTPPPANSPGAPPPAGGPPVRAKTLDPLEALLASGPPTRGPTPTGAARKKNLRSRYVDVLEQS